MTIIALEGPSAVGKTTTAKRLCEELDASRVPEVNELFDRPPSAPETWYFECQCDRWELALERESDYEFVILDGDVLQPLWYNWIARGLAAADPSIEVFASVDAVYSFFREKLRTEAIGFPDRYLVLTADERTLRRRKGTDDTRTRRNFETHIRFAEPQQRYFEQLRELAPPRVHFVDATSGEGTSTTVRVEASRCGASSSRFPLNHFDTMYEWLSETRPLSVDG
ncbi:hypothetical protein [Haloarchaeobius sp. DFWS5]|uniref:hypothetical protein n=1 Tax=Haloarchaeobius sp. DFWS5 TaxID=3446114 RepID=UPI003EB72CAF